MTWRKQCFCSKHWNPAIYKSKCLPRKEIQAYQFCIPQYVVIYTSIWIELKYHIHFATNVLKGLWQNGHSNKFPPVINTTFPLSPSPFPKLKGEIFSLHEASSCKCDIMPGYGLAYLALPLHLIPGHIWNNPISQLTRLAFLKLDRLSILSW